MSRRFAVPVLLIAAIALGGCAATWEQVHTGYAEDLSYYYDDFDRYGRWVDVAPYGWAWCPDVSSAWSPYTVGYWVYTDDGWFWVSEDPWGWVPYHYGQWAFDDDYGWVWVPGNVWAPAWVAWRYGSGWVGWAPLPPDISWHVHVGLELTSYELDRHIHHRYWSFMRAQDLGTHRVRVRVERPDRNEKLLKETRNVTRYAAGPRPKEEGMRPDLIREIRGKKVERYRIVDSRKPVPKGGLTIRERQVEVNRPDVDVKGIVRERMRAVPPQKRAEATPPAVERAVREREEPESRVAQRERVAMEPLREIKGREQREAAREQRHEPEVQARKPVDERPKRAVEERAQVERKRDEDRRGRQREATREREENAHQREEVAKRQDREEATRQREETARQREDKARQREEATQKREENARDRDEDNARQRKESARDRDETNPRQREEAARERTSESKGRTRGR